MKLLTTLLTLSGVSLALTGSPPHGPRRQGNKPNIVMIMTDDQDLLMDSLNYQPAVRSYFGENGTFFSKHYCSESLDTFEAERNWLVPSVMVLADSILPSSLSHLSIVIKIC